MGLRAFKYYTFTPPFVINKKYRRKQKKEMRKTKWENSIRKHIVQNQFIFRSTWIVQKH